MTNKERGLYGKYHITKADGSAVDKNAEYFVLRLDSNDTQGIPEIIAHRIASRNAIVKYAELVKDELPQLSKELLEKYG